MMDLPSALNGDAQRAISAIGGRVNNGAGAETPVQLGGRIGARVEAGRVHGSLYTDPAVFDAELRRIFHDGWSFVGHQSEVPEAGDWVTRRLGRDPVLLVHTRAGQTVVLANRSSNLSAPAKPSIGTPRCLLAGAGDRFNTRVLRQSEAAMGPAGFLLPDDAAASERTQAAFSGTGGWMDLSRGLNRETRHGTDRVGHVSDETTNRGFWHHYATVMSGAGAGG